MKYLLGSLCALVIGCATDLQAETFTAKPPAAYSEQKPDYLYFKDVTVTKGAGNSYEFDVTLYGKIPGNMKDKISFYIGFDIDSSTTTGGVSANSPNFGQDIGAWFTKQKGTNRFEESGGTSKFKGKPVEMKVTGMKVADDKLTFKLRCPLFSDFDSSKFFVSSSRVQYDGDVVVSDTQVDTIKGTISK